MFVYLLTNNLLITSIAVATNPINAHEKGQLSLFQYKMNIADDEIGRIIHDEFENEFCDSFILVGEDETCLPRYYKNFEESIKNFEVKNSDIMVCSYAKTGTTWTQEMVWMIMNDLDLEGGKACIDERFPFLEICSLYDFEKLNDVLGGRRPEFITDSLECAKRQKDPRFIKTHLPFSLLPEEIRNGSKSPKIIYVVRNPKDVCVSYFHHGRLLQGWRANLEIFSKVFLADKVMYGSFWKHVLGFWQRKSSLNLLIITYEDMKRDLRSVVRRVARFLNKELTEDQVNQLCEHLSFESMKNNKSLNLEDHMDLRKQKGLTLEDGCFIRSGVVGKYKEEMSPEIIKQFDLWTKNSVGVEEFLQEYGYNTEA